MTAHIASQGMQPRSHPGLARYTGPFTPTRPPVLVSFLTGCSRGGESAVRRARARFRTIASILAVSALVTPPVPSAAAAQASLAKSEDRARESDWAIADSTDNNTGEREVYAFQSIFDPEYVTLRMRCSKGKPTLFVEWSDTQLPDQAVVTIGPLDEPEVGVAGEGYVFTKSTDVLEHGWRATAETSSKIVSAIGNAKFLSVTAHLAIGPRSISMDVDGTQRAWNRVVRHCPIKLMPKPPL